MMDHIPVSIGVDIGDKKIRVAYISEGMKGPNLVCVNGESAINSKVGFTKGKIEWGPLAPKTPLKAKDCFEGFKSIFHKSGNVYNPNWTFQKVIVGSTLRFSLGGNDEFNPASMFVLLLHKLWLAVSESIASELHVDLNRIVFDTTVSLPRCFNMPQKLAIKAALEHAGFPAVTPCEDTVAAAFSYIVSNHTSCGNLFVFSTGAGFTSAGCFTVMRIGMVAANYRSSFDTGGNSVTDILFQKAKALFEKNYPGEIDWNKSVNVYKLREECEKAKGVLKDDSVEIRLEINGEELVAELSPRDLLEASDSLQQRSVNLAFEVLSNSNVDKADITDAILVGGGSRLGPIESKIQSMFSPMNMAIGVVAEEAVVRGAAIIGWQNRLRSKHFHLAWAMYKQDDHAETALFEFLSKPSLNNLLPNIFYGEVFPPQILIANMEHVDNRPIFVRNCVDEGIQVTVRQTNGDFTPLPLKFGFSSLPHLNFSADEIENLLQRDKNESERGNLVNDLAKLARDIDEWNSKSVLCKSVYASYLDKLNQTKKTRSTFSLDELKALRSEIVSGITAEVLKCHSPFANCVDFMDQSLSSSHRMKAFLDSGSFLQSEQFLLNLWKQTVKKVVPLLLHEMDRKDLRSASGTWDTLVKDLGKVQNQVEELQVEQVAFVATNFQSEFNNAETEFVALMKEKFEGFNYQPPPLDCVLRARAIANEYQTQVHKAQEAEAIFKQAMENELKKWQRMPADKALEQIQARIQYYQSLLPLFAPPVSIEECDSETGHLNV